MESDTVQKEAPTKGYYMGMIVSDDNTNMRAHLKHASTHKKGKLPVSYNTFYHHYLFFTKICYYSKLQDNIPEPTFKADPLHRIKVIGNFFMH